MNGFFCHILFRIVVLLVLQEWHVLHGRSADGNAEHTTRWLVLCQHGRPRRNRNLFPVSSFSIEEDECVRKPCYATLNLFWLGVKYYCKRKRWDTHVTHCDDGATWVFTRSGISSNLGQTRRLRILSSQLAIRCLQKQPTVFRRGFFCGRLSFV